MTDQSKCYLLDVDGQPAMVRGTMPPEKMAPETVEAIREMIRAARTRAAELEVRP